MHDSTACHDVTAQLTEEWFPIVTTFNSQTKANSRDIELIRRNISLPVWLRVFHAYCDHNYERSQLGFQEMIGDFIAAGVIIPFNLKELLDCILRSSGKTNMILLVDECLMLDRELKQGSPQEQLFIQVMRELNCLQDNLTGNQYRVVYSGLHDCP